MIAIVLALGASLLWGLTNFVGGLQARLAVLGSLHPVVTIAAARLGLGERIVRIQWVGTAVTFAGVALVVAG